MLQSRISRRDSLNIVALSEGVTKIGDETLVPKHLTGPDATGMQERLYELETAQRLAREHRRGVWKQSKASDGDHGDEGLRRAKLHLAKDVGKTALQTSGRFAFGFLKGFISSIRSILRSQGGKKK